MIERFNITASKWTERSTLYSGRRT